MTPPPNTRVSGPRSAPLRSPLSLWERQARQELCHQLRAHVRRTARPPRPVVVLAGVSIDVGAGLGLPAGTKTPPRFTRDGVHSVGAAYLCEGHGLCERPGRRLELKTTPAPGRLVIV
jgi:hypothetical protein